MVSPFLLRLAGWSRLAPVWRPRSIKGKLVLINAAGLGAALTAVATLLLIEGFVTGRRASLENTQTLARAIAGNSGAALAFGDGRAGAQILEAFRTSPAVVAAAIRSADGRLLARYGDPAWRVPDYLAAKPPWYQFRGGHLEVVEPVAVAGRVVGLVAVRSSLAGLEAQLVRTALIVAPVSALALTGALLLALRLFRAVTVPLGHLAALMSEVSHDGSYDRRAEAHSDDEIGSLARSFNAMLEQMQRRDAELGHELQERKRAEKLLDELAHYDSVTGLPNRNLFFKHLGVALARRVRTGKSVALLFLDLDDFKIVNDTMGHPAGDRLLRGVGQRFTETLRTTDAAYRLGGDEFAVLVQDVTGKGQAATVATKLLACAERPFLIDGQQIQIGASIGISLSPDDGDQAEALLKNADVAMYCAKGTGKGRFAFFSGEMRDAVENLQPGRPPSPGGLRGAAG